MEADKAIRMFAEFLNNSWYGVQQLLINRTYTSDEDSLNDWLQLNWELLIERHLLKINDYLEFYGDGADFNGASSRITDPSAIANYRIKVVPKNGDPIYDVLNEEEIVLADSTFDKLVGFKNGFYVLEPDFSYIKLDVKGKERVVRIIDVMFELDEL